MRKATVLKAYSPAFHGDNNLEGTGRIILPHTMLSEIYQGDSAPDVLIFQIMNRSTKAVIYAAVFEFTSEPDTIIMPYWMMKYIDLEEGNDVTITLKKPSVGKSATFQPLDAQFTKISNPKVVLERALRDHLCLNQGSQIPIEFGNKKYILKVLKTTPTQSILIHKVDLICEFAPPVTQFSHKWFDEDSDSDNEKIKPKTHSGRTRSGKVIEIKDEVRPMHSTFEMRENERRSNKMVEGVRKFELGKEILPPRPEEDEMKSLEKKEMLNKELFRGVPKHAKKQKTPKEVEKVEIEEPKPASPFSGQGRTIRSTKPTSKLEILPEPEEIPMKPPTTFTGTGKTIRGKVVTIEQPQIKEAPKDENALYGKPKEEEPFDPFKGSGKTIKK